MFSIEVPARLKEHAQALGGTHGTLKFQVTGTTPRSWLVRLDGPQSRVLQGDHAADCTITAQDSVILEVASGRLHPLLALQDGRMQAKGNLELLQKLRWIL
jgi:ubiquinone biosynthesis protein UbiJ